MAAPPKWKSDFEDDAARWPVSRLSLVPDPNVGALTQIFREYAPSGSPLILESVVADTIVRQVSFSGWNETQAGDRTVRKEVQLVLKKVRPADHRGAVRSGLCLHPGERLMATSVERIADEFGSRER